MIFKLPRFIVTFNIASLHLFTFFRLTLRRLYKCLRKDTEYLQLFREKQDGYALPVTSFDDLEDGSLKSEAIVTFLNYCRAKAILVIEDVYVDPNDLVEAYMELKLWGRNFNPDKLKKATNSYQDLLTKYILVGTDRYIPAPIHVKRSLFEAEKTKYTFNAFLEYLWEILEQNYAYEFLNSELLPDGEYSELFQYAKLEKVSKRLQGADLMDRYKPRGIPQKGNEFKTLCEHIDESHFHGDSGSESDSEEDTVIYTELKDFKPPNYSSLSDLRDKLK